jgi:hypothetical protein
MALKSGHGKGDISTLPGGRHFYFALTTYKMRIAPAVAMWSNFRVTREIRRSGVR